MKRTAIPAAVVALALALGVPAGAALAQGKAAPGGTHTVKVRVVGDVYLVLDQHPVVIMEADRIGKIVWELPGKPSPWRFGNDGIAIDGGQFLGCRAEAGGLRFACVDKPPPRKKELYPYRLTVTNEAGKTLYVDSAVQND
jgi:hypothetical protein